MLLHSNLTGAKSRVRRGRFSAACNGGAVGVTWWSIPHLTATHGHFWTASLHIYMIVDTVFSLSEALWCTRWCRGCRIMVTVIIIPLYCSTSWVQSCLYKVQIGILWPAHSLPYFIKILIGYMTTLLYFSCSTYLYSPFALWCTNHTATW